MKASAAITIGEQVVETVLPDVEAFLAWLKSNNDAADDAQLQANHGALAAAIAEEKQKAGQ